MYIAHTSKIYQLSKTFNLLSL